MSATTRAELLRLCEELLVELRRMQHEGEVLAPWADDSAPDDFPFLKRLARLADAALDAGAPAHYQRLHGLHERPVRMPDSLWRLTEMIAALAECAEWARLAPAPAPAPVAHAASLKAQASTDPGKRLRGGREIMEAIEGAYSYARWRAFRREALKHGAPIEWPKGPGQPRAYANVLKQWLANRVEAVERAAEERDATLPPEIGGKTGKQAYTGGDDQPLGVVKRPSGRRTR